MQRHKILLVEDHRVVTTGLTALINFESDLEVCGTAEDPSTALQAIEKLQPDLVLVDLTLNGRSGLELLKDINLRFPKLKTLVLSMHNETLYAIRALRAGARGYVMKGEATDTLLVAIRRVLEGDTYLSPRMEKQAMQRMLHRQTVQLDPVETLSDRELEVFRLIGQGKGTRDISKLLFLSIKTIESHRAHIKEKLGLPSGADLVKQAILFEQDAGFQPADEPAPDAAPSPTVAATA